MLHPMTGLLANLVEAQSAAVRGEQVDASSVRNSLAAVAKVDRPVAPISRNPPAPDEPHHAGRIGAVAAPTGPDGYGVYTDWSPSPWT